jgi:hypothetical protein
MSLGPGDVSCARVKRWRGDKWIGKQPIKRHLRTKPGFQMLTASGFLSPRAVVRAWTPCGVSVCAVTQKPSRVYRTEAMEHHGLCCVGEMRSQWSRT